MASDTNTHADVVRIANEARDKMLKDFDPQPNHQGAELAQRDILVRHDNHAVQVVVRRLLLAFVEKMGLGRMDAVKTIKNSSKRSSEELTYRYLCLVLRYSGVFENFIPSQRLASTARLNELTPTRAVLSHLLSTFKIRSIGSTSFSDVTRRPASRPSQDVRKPLQGHFPRYCKSASRSPISYLKSPRRP